MKLHGLYKKPVFIVLSCLLFVTLIVTITIAIKLSADHHYYEKNSDTIFKELYMKGETDNITIGCNGETITLGEPLFEYFTNLIVGIAEMDNRKPFNGTFQKDGEKCITLSVKDVVDMFLYPYDDTSSILVVNINGKPSKTYKNIFPYETHLAAYESAKNEVKSLL